MGLHGRGVWGQSAANTGASWKKCPHCGRRFYLRGLRSNGHKYNEETGEIVCFRKDKLLSKEEVVAALMEFSGLSEEQVRKIVYRKKG